MRWQKLIRLEKDGVSLAADVNAAIAVNRGETNTVESVSVSHVRVVQDSRRRGQDSSGAQAPNNEEDPDGR